MKLDNPNFFKCKVAASTAVSPEARKEVLDKIESVMGELEESTVPSTLSKKRYVAALQIAGTWVEIVQKLVPSVLAGVTTSKAVLRRALLVPLSLIDVIFWLGTVICLLISWSRDLMRIVLAFILKKKRISPYVITFFVTKNGHSYRQYASWKTLINNQLDNW
jgi:hypothetical protein